MVFYNWQKLKTNFKFKISSYSKLTIQLIFQMLIDYVSPNQTHTHVHTLLRSIKGICSHTCYLKATKPAKERDHLFYKYSACDSYLPSLIIYLFIDFLGSSTCIWRTWSALDWTWSTLDMKSGRRVCLFFAQGSLIILFRFF